MTVLTSEETAALSFRAFGYFTTKTAISQRTVNDAAAIVDYLRAQP
jgi:hypothetical protein